MVGRELKEMTWSFPELSISINLLGTSCHGSAPVNVHESVRSGMIRNAEINNRKSLHRTCQWYMVLEKFFIFSVLPVSNAISLILFLRGSCSQTSSKFHISSIIFLKKKPSLIGWELDRFQYGTLKSVPTLAMSMHECKQISRALALFAVCLHDAATIYFYSSEEEDKL